MQDNSNLQREIISIQETLDSYGWKLYQQELEKEFKKADTEVHRAEKTEEFWKSQGYYSMLLRILKIPETMIEDRKEILVKEGSVHQPLKV